MSATATMPRETEEFEFEAGSGSFGEGPSRPGFYPGTLLTIGKPAPSQHANDQGKKPLTSTFDWSFDAFTEEDEEGNQVTIDDFTKWSYVNVEARGDGSNFNKFHMAAFGTPVPRGPFKSKILLGARVLLDWGPSKNDATKFTIRGYAPMPKPRPAARRAAPPPPPPQRETFGGEDEEPF